ILRDADFFPSTGAVFPVIVAEAQTGALSTINGTAIDATHFFTPQYTATDVDLVVGTSGKPPAVVNPIADLVRDEDAGPVPCYADLNQVFEDPDDPDRALSYAVRANTPSGIVSAMIQADGALDLSLIADQNGIVQITVRATDPDGLFAEHSFQVTVN